MKKGTDATNVNSNSGNIGCDVLRAREKIDTCELQLRGPIKSAVRTQPVEICSDVVMKGNLTVSGTVASNTCIVQLNLANVTYEARTDVAGYGGVNIKAYTIKSGNPGKNLLFIAGLAHSHLMWKNQFLDGQLSTQHNIYAYDWRSQGESDRPAVTGPGPADTVYAPGENHADDLNAVITTLGIAPCVLVAHSYGNAPLREYIRKYGTGSLSGIVLGSGESLVNSIVVGSGLTPALLALSALATSPNYIDNVQGWEQFVDLSSACTFDKSTRDTFMTANSLPPSVTGALSSFIPGPRGGPPPVNNDAWYASINKPTLIVQGSVDGLIKPGEPYLIRDKLLAVSPIVPTVKIYPGIGHLFPLENYPTFNADLLVWLLTF